MTECIGRLARVAEEIGDDRGAWDALALAERVNEGRFFVACVGQFKRGKSTLVDALLGERVLPVGVVPVTALPTVVRYGDSIRARVRMQSGSWTDIEPAMLEQYVSEEHNPENERGVIGAEVYVPNRLLADGMCLVDTPGLGSVLTANADTTREFLPHIDAAIVVLGADPPITAEELDLVEEINRRAPDLLFVLNKADRVDETERAAAQAFAQKMIAARLGRDPGPIWIVSAAQQLDRGSSSWEWNLFAEALERLSRDSARRLVRGAVERGVDRLSDRLFAQISARASALVEPMDQVARRVAILDRVVADAERSISDLAPLFEAEQRRLADECARRRGALALDAQAIARRDLKTWMTTRRGRGIAFRKAALEKAQALAREHVSSWLAGEQEWAERVYRRTTERFIGAAHDLVARLVAMEPVALERLSGKLDADEGFTERSRFYFHEYQALADPASPLRNAADVICGALGLRHGIERRALAFLNHLLDVNTARVESDLRDRVAESRQRLEMLITALLRDLASSARRSMEAASHVRAHGKPATDAALLRLTQLRSAVEVIQVPRA